MATPLREAPADDAFAHAIDLDPEVARDKQQQRRYRLNVVQIPILRLFGFGLLAIFVFLHNRFVLGSFAWSAFLPLLCGLLTYVLVSWLVLYLLFARVQRIDLGVLFLTLDLLVCTLLIYGSGGEKSWLFFLPLMRVADQTNTNFKRVLAFAHLAVLSYALLLLYVSAFEQRPIVWPGEVAKIVALYGTSLYISFTARTAEQLRNRTRAAIRMARAVIRQLAGQTRVLELIATGASLSSVLEVLVQTTEEQARGMLCAILLLDHKAGQLRYGAAPGLPEGHRQAVHSLAPDLFAGFSASDTPPRRPLIAADIATDLRWESYRQYMLPHGLRSCWSMPIVAADGHVLGTFAMYGDTPRHPGTDEVQLMARATHSAGIAIDMEGKREEETLRRSEASYRALIQGAEYGIFRCTSDGRFLDANPAFVAMLGYESDTELLASSMAAHLSQSPEGRAPFIGLLQESERIKDLEVERARKDGAPITIRLSGRAVRDQDGALAYLEAIVENVTARRALEAQLRQAQKMDAVGRLAGGIAHDFTNLLGAIMSDCDIILLHRSNDDPIRPYVEGIKEAARRAASRVRQLLAFSRRQSLQPTVLDINAMVANLTPILHALMRENIDLVLALAPDLGYVKVDPTQMEQVIIHLAVNARDAMPSRGRLTLTTANIARDDVSAPAHLGMTPGRYVLLSISDTGSGMDADTRAHIFEPFFTTKGVGEGTGLGLSIVYGIVTESGGYISIDSMPGRGATFTIYLPRVEDAVGPDAPHPSYTKLPQGQETILVVEAVAAIRHALEHMLHMIGYTVLTASDGGEALRLCAQGPVHLLLTDVVLPGLDGRTMVDHLASLRPAMKVLYMAGSPHDTMDGVVVAGTALLQKPFSLETLAWKVREVLDAHG